jgi:hypothetical protein
MNLLARTSLISSKSCSRRRRPSIMQTFSWLVDSNLMVATSCSLSWTSQACSISYFFIVWKLSIEASFLGPVNLYWDMRTAVRSLSLRRDSIVGQASVRILPRSRTVGRQCQVAGMPRSCAGAVIIDIDDLPDHSTYLCGSPEMIADAKQAFIARGASIARIYTEGFAFQLAQPVVSACSLRSGSGFGPVPFATSSRSFGIRRSGSLAMFSMLMSRYVACNRAHCAL